MLKELLKLCYDLKIIPRMIDEEDAEFDEIVKRYNDNLRFPPDSLR